MALTVRDAESSYLTARATVEKWRGEYMAQWLQPDIDLALLALDVRIRMDPVALQTLKDMTPPDQWRKFEDRIKEARARLQNGTGK